MNDGSATPELPFARELAELEGPDRLRKRPRQERSRALTQSILEAALRVLGQDGLDGLTTVRVAEVAGVSVGSLYQYFPGRQALMAAALAHYLDSLTRDVLQAAEGFRGEPAESALRAVLSAFVHSKIRLAGASRAFRPLLASGTHQTLVRAARGRAVEGVAIMLSTMPDLDLPDPSDSAWILVAAVEGVLRAAVVDHTGPVDAGRLEIRVFDLAWGFIGHHACRQGNAPNANPAAQTSKKVAGSGS